MIYCIARRSGRAGEDEHKYTYRLSSPRIASIYTPLPSYLVSPPTCLHLLADQYETVTTSIIWRSPLVQSSFTFNKIDILCTYASKFLHPVCKHFQTSGLTHRNKNSSSPSWASNHSAYLSLYFESFSLILASICASTLCASCAVAAEMGDLWVDDDIV